MQGRCDNDPLDSANDVCELCGGEYCETCLIHPRGRKNKPVCKGCALRNSGLRGGSRVERRNDRRAAKKRRAELAETRDERDSNTFVFFDEEEDHTYDLPQETEEEPKKVKRRRVSIGRHRKSDEATAAEATDGPDPGEGHEGLGDEPEPLEQTADSQEQASPAVTRDPNEVLAELADSRPSHAPAPTASELLAKLREEEAVPPPGAVMPAVSPPPPPPKITPEVAPAAPARAMDDSFDPTIDPFALTTTDPFDLPAPSAVHPGPPVNPPYVDTPAPGPPAGAAAVELNPSTGAEFVDPFAAEAASLPPPAPTDTPASVPASPPQTTDRPSLLSRLDAEAPVTAPQKAPMPAWVPPSVTPDPAAAADEGPMEPALLSRITAAEPEQRPHPEPQPEPEQRPRPTRSPERSGSADIDDDGNWVPPALRGMAPKAEREADLLPRRR